MKTTLYNLNKQDRFFFFFFFFIYTHFFKYLTGCYDSKRVAINYRYNEIIFTNYGDTVLIYTDIIVPIRETVFITKLRQLNILSLVFKILFRI